MYGYQAGWKYHTETIDGQMTEEEAKAMLHKLENELLTEEQTESEEVWRLQTVNTYSWARNR